jgi:hypothetical protein
MFLLGLTPGTYFAFVDCELAAALLFEMGYLAVVDVI